MNAIRMMLSILALTLLTGCAPDKLDTSTEEEAKASIEKISSRLSDEQKPKFQTAIKEAILQSVFSGQGTDLRLALMEYSGKTGVEIIAQHQEKVAAKAADQAAKAAERAAERAAQQAKRKAELEAKLVELKAEQENRMLALDKLKLVKINDAKIENQNHGFIIQYKFVATISNESDVTLTKVKFNLRVISPVREVPWYKDEGIFFIDGGLQPGEARKESAYGDGFILANKAMKEHPDAVLEWVVIDAYGVDEKSILPSDQSAEIERIEREIKIELAMP
ncbi:MAG: DUF6694 family lipoprotein [Desulfobulbaceae bacterium]